MSSSVRSGAISLIELTRVVLPTPNPPAIASLTAVIPTLSSPGLVTGSESTNAIDDRLEYVGIRSGFGTEEDQLQVDEISDQNFHDAEWQPKPGGQFGNRGGTGAHREDL